MKVGLHIADFTFPHGPSGLAQDLRRIVADGENIDTILTEKVIPIAAGF